MNSMLDSDDVDLSEILCVRDEDGRPALRIGLLATMFITEPWTRPVREAVADAAEEYLRQFREHLCWAMHPKTGHMHAIKKGRVPLPQNWLPRHTDGESWSFGFHGGEQANAASEFQVAGLGSDAIGKDPGYFQVYLPLTWFADHPGTFPGHDAVRRMHPGRTDGDLPGRLSGLTLEGPGSDQGARRNDSRTTYGGRRCRSGRPNG